MGPILLAVVAPIADITAPSLPFVGGAGGRGLGLGA
jgi:hypothetical protein